MSHFYGTLKGQRGQATRCGSKSSGITTQTASWAGAVEVSAWHDTRTETDMVEVRLIPWRNGAGTKRLLYRGPVNGGPPGRAV